MLTVCYSAKGGQGCSTITAMLALLHPPVTMVDTAGDLPAFDINLDVLWLTVTVHLPALLKVVPRPEHG